jgi:hypothetical protein
MLGPWQREHYGKANNHASKVRGGSAQDKNKGAPWRGVGPCYADAPPPSAAGPPRPAAHTPTERLSLNNATSYNFMRTCS